MTTTFTITAAGNLKYYKPQISQTSNITNLKHHKPQTSQTSNITNLKYHKPTSTSKDNVSCRRRRISPAATLEQTFNQLWHMDMDFDGAALLLRGRKDPLRLYFWSRLLAEIVRNFPQSLQANIRVLLQTTQPVSFLILTN